MSASRGYVDLMRELNAARAKLSRIRSAAMPLREFVEDVRRHNANPTKPVRDAEALLAQIFSEKEQTP